MKNINDELTLTVYDEEQFTSPDLIGLTVIKFSQLCVKSGLDAWFAIQYKGADCGQVHFKGEWIPVPGPKSKKDAHASAEKTSKIQN